MKPISTYVVLLKNHANELHGSSWKSTTATAQTIESADGLETIHLANATEGRGDCFTSISRRGSLGFHTQISRSKGKAGASKCFAHAASGMPVKDTKGTVMTYPRTRIARLSWCLLDRREEENE